MASITNLPFSFKPVSSPIRVTSSYTVPVGRVAMACLYFYGMSSRGGSSLPAQSPNTITVNGNNVLSEKAFGFFNQNLNFSVSFNGGDFFGIFSSCSRGTTAGTSSWADTQAVGTSLSNSITGSGPLSMSGTCININESGVAYVWLKAGDVINGSGLWCAIVNLFEVS